MYDSLILHSNNNNNNNNVVPKLRTHPSRLCTSVHLQQKLTATKLDNCGRGADIHEYYDTEIIKLVLLNTGVTEHVHMTHQPMVKCVTRCAVS
jgi:hypothetical protein